MGKEYSISLFSRARRVDSLSQGRIVRLDKSPDYGLKGRSEEVLIRTRNNSGIIQNVSFINEFP